MPIARFSHSHWERLENRLGEVEVDMWGVRGGGYGTAKDDPTANLTWGGTRP